MPFTNYKALFESSNNGRMLIYEKCIIECNNKVHEILQLPPESLIGKNFAHALSLTQAYGEFAEQNLSEKLGKVLNGENQVLDWFYLSANQETINVEINLNKTSIDNKDYIEVHIIDTTQRNRLQQAINYIASESVHDEDNSFFEKLMQKLAEIFNTQYAFIGLLNDDFTLIQTLAIYAHGKISNNLTYELLDSASAGVIGKAPCAYPHNVQHLFPNDTLLNELAVDSYIGIPLFNSKNIPIGLLAILDNKALNHTSHIIEIMQIYGLRIASEIERLNTNKELKKAKEAAEQAYQAKAEFLSNMSHELRTPLHAILSYSSFGIKKENLSSEKLSKYFNAIHLSGDRLLHLVNDLLDLSKMEAGKFLLNLSNENLSIIINDSLEELKYATDTKHIRVKLNPHDSIISLLCDKSLIHQLLVNILTNAIKFSPQDSSIEILTQYIEPEHFDSGSIYITVRDYGIGIPEQELNSIFNEFIQSSATKTGAGGTGLGLAISKNIVKAHHGKIWVTNNTNEKGATFHITLPCDINSIAE